MKSKILSVVILVCLLFMIVSCRSFSFSAGSGRQYKHKSGPPPHAPAHGYRHRHQGVEMVYDSGMGVYVVIDFPDYYYFKGRYYRFGESQWEVGVSLNGPWKFVSRYDLPKGLQIKKKGKGKAWGKSK
jgi:hypothetical protein